MRHYTGSDYDRAAGAFESIFPGTPEPFRQLGNLRGVSDDTAGVQWNVVCDHHAERVRLGVNLEGMKYNGSKASWYEVTDDLVQYSEHKICGVRMQGQTA